MPLNGVDSTDRVLIALTALALNCPSTFTIAWSKEQHKEEMPILYAGIGTSAATVLGAILGDKWGGDKLMWAGLLATLGLFGYVAFFYKPKNGNGSYNKDGPLIIGAPHNGHGNSFTHLMV